MSKTANVGSVSGAEHWEVDTISQETVRVDGSTSIAKIECTGVSFLPASTVVGGSASKGGELIVEGSNASAFAAVQSGQPTRIRFNVKYFSEPRIFYIEGVEAGPDGRVTLQLPGLDAQTAGSAIGDSEINRFLPPEET